MAFNHRTIGIKPSASNVNVNYAIENVTLTSVGLSLGRQAIAKPSLSYKLGLTPPGDEDVECYLVLASGLLSPGDGQHWSGSIKIKDTIYIVLNYIAVDPCFALLTWTTT